MVDHGILDINGATENQITEALKDSFNESQIAELLPQILEYQKIDTQQQQKLNADFNNQLKNVANTNDKISLLQESYYRESLGGGEKIAEATQLDLGQEMLVQAFAQLDAERQREIAEAIRSGDSLVQA